MIRALFIPADLSKKVELVNIEATDAAAYREYVGGPLEVVTLFKPASTGYVNENGKLERKPLNERMTHLCWVHSPFIRGHDVIVGDAILVGPPDKRLYEQTVPKYFRDCILTEGKVTLEYRRDGSRRWIISSLVFREWSQAYAYGASFMHETPGVTELRVVPLGES